MGTSSSQTLFKLHTLPTYILGKNYRALSPFINPPSNVFFPGPTKENAYEDIRALPLPLWKVPSVWKLPPPRSISRAPKVGWGDSRLRCLQNHSPLFVLTPSLILHTASHWFYCLLLMYIIYNVNNGQPWQLIKLLRSKRAGPKEIW